MNWNELIHSVDIITNGGEGNPFVTDIVFDSRQVTVGSLFVAVKGFNVDGDEFIDSAIKKGAVAIVSQNSQFKISVPWIQVENSRVSMSQLAATLFDINFNDMKTVGITGTNGKTTTATLYRNFFSNIFSKESSLLFGTISYEIGNKVLEATRTTPESVDLMRLVKNSDVPPKSLVMEVASHALELSRIEGFKFDIAIWTNLTQDHLDFHETMDNYYLAKKKLFLNNLKSTGYTIINIDDSWGAKLYAELENINNLSYGKCENSDVRIISIQCGWDGSIIDIEYNKNEYQFSTSLVGEFNVYNVTALIAGALALGYNVKDIQTGLDLTSGVTGRMQKVESDIPFSIIVDYAHTPDALENVLSTARKLTSGRVITVFGSGGDRDKSKRPLMATAVAQNSDISIITTDNPRTEKPADIIKDVMKGIPLDRPCHVVEDRYEAIKKAINIAKPNDTIVIAGKGHETYQEVNGVKSHFDDLEVATKLAKELE